MTRKACALTLSALMVATVLLCAAPTGVAAAGSAGTPQSIYKAWGYNNHGQLGNRSNTDSNTPVIVSGLTGMVAVSGGGYHSLALMSDRTVWTWGWNLYGQLGDGTNNDSNAPAAIPGLSGVAAVSGGYYHSLALGSDGTVQSWGYNAQGQLGDGTNNDSNIPVAVSGLAGVIAVSAGGLHNLALENDGTVRAWGYDGFGQLGDGTNNDSNIPVEVSGLTGVATVSAGGAFSLALMSDGTVRAWGRNIYGELGDGTNNDSNIPVEVSGLTGVVAVSAGFYHSLALMSDGTVRAWGRNIYGELGDGTENDSNVPVEVSGFTGVIAVSAGSVHSLALKSDGTVWAWGFNGQGQLGDGTNNDSNTPVAVSGLTGVFAVVSGGRHNLALSCHTITASAGANGTVSPGGAVTVNEAADQAFTITPDLHYGIKKITVDDSSVGIPPISPYNFTNVTADHTITAEFEMITHSITVTQGAHGNITPAGTAGVVSENDGADQVFTIKPDLNYHVVDVLVDGSSVGPATSYTLHNITANHAVTASFASDSSTWYLAEGSTAWGFDCYISIENPNTDAVHAAITYMTTDGTVSGGTVTLPAMSQATVNPAEKLGRTDFSTKVTCTENKAICCDRTMSWTGTGAASPEGHSSVGVTSPARTWYLPEGSSAWGFECWLLIQNPNSTAATTRVTYMIEGAGPVIKTRTVPANSRQSFNIGDDIGARDASIKVTSNVPVIPERAMYRDNKREGHDSVGTNATSNDYYLAEGTTAWGFTTYVLIQNPSSAASTVTVTYMTPTGKKVQPSFSLPGNSRKTIRVNDVGGMADTDFSTQVHGSAPIIAERAMYWGAGTPLGEACHDSIGMESPHACFYLPDGGTSNGRETWTLVQNPNASAVTVEVSYLKDGGGAETLTSTIPANSRMTFNMADKIPSGRASIMVTSKTSGKKIMCERAMYWNNRGAGTDTIGGFSD